MAQLPPPRTLASAQDIAAKAKTGGPKVASYYDAVHQAAWIGRTSGLWAGAAIGTALGAGIGTAASFLPYAMNFGGLPDTLGVLSVAGLGAGLGTGFGLVIFPDVAVTASAVAAGFEERERRDAMKELHAANPQLAAKIERERAQALPKEHAEAGHGSLVSRGVKAFKKYYNVKVGAMGFALGAALGAIMTLNPYSANALLGSSGLNILEKGATLASTEAIAAAAGIIGMVGAVFGLKMSLISNLGTNQAYQMLTGKIFESAPEKTPEPQLALPQPIQEIQFRSDHLETLLARQAATAEAQAMARI
jgi:hypothetical protein